MFRHSLPAQLLGGAYYPFPLTKVRRPLSFEKAGYEKKNVFSACIIGAGDVGRDCSPSPPSSLLHSTAVNKYLFTAVEWRREEETIELGRSQSGCFLGQSLVSQFPPLRTNFFCIRLLSQPPPITTLTLGATARNPNYQGSRVYPNYRGSRTQP
jgi:hypothetical protein